MKSAITITLLIFSNAFMTLAWYGHLKFKEMKWSENLGLNPIILISWGIALFEYALQVPANRAFNSMEVLFLWCNLKLFRK